MEKNTKKKKIVLPVVPLRGKVAFPGTIFSFDAGRPGTIEAIKISSSQYNGEILICTQKDTDKNDVAAEDMYSVGTVAEIKQVTNLPGGAVRVVAEGQRAVKVKAFTLTDCFYAECAERKTVHGDPVIEEAYLRSARALVADVLISEGKLNKETVAKLELTADADEYVNAVVNAMRVRLDVKQRILEETDAVERLKLLEQCLNDELEISKIEKRISSAVRQSIERSQKDYYLREQLKAIHGELGDDGKEQDKYREKAEEKHLPDYMREKFLKEVDRLDKMQPSSPEYTVVTSYLDQVLELPWTEETKDTDKLSDAAAILNEDHYALEKIKDRICEYLAVLKLTGNMKAPILCFVGPPGVGKTTLAKIVATQLERPFFTLSAVTSGVKDVREVIESARKQRFFDQKAPLLFIDEIHRFNKSQQDSLLGAVEQGVFTLIGATTENPSFEVISPLLSRCQVYILKSLEDKDLQTLLDRALTTDTELKERDIEVTETGALFRFSGGDARKLLNILEIVVGATDGKVTITDRYVTDCLQQNIALYDKNGEQHYDVISAFIKSVRGSDPNAAIYYLARMLAGGEEPRFLARRLVILASEDIGLANPNALLLANACFDTVHKIGMPEARITLAETTIYLATSPKSNSAYMAINKAMGLVEHDTTNRPVPLHLRNAPTKLMDRAGYGKGYKYAHDYPNHYVHQQYLPTEIQGEHFYELSEMGYEKTLKEYQNKIKSQS